MESRFVNNKQKVCIFSTGHPALVGRIFHKQAMTLVKAGYDVTLIARHERDEIIGGVKIVNLPNRENVLNGLVG